MHVRKRSSRAGERLSRIWFRCCAPKSCRHGERPRLAPFLGRRDPAVWLSYSRYSRVSEQPALEETNDGEYKSYNGDGPRFSSCLTNHCWSGRIGEHWHIDVFCRAPRGQRKCELSDKSGGKAASSHALQVEHLLSEVLTRRCLSQGTGPFINICPLNKTSPISLHTGRWILRFTYLQIIALAKFGVRLHPVVPRLFQLSLKRQSAIV